MRRQTTFLLFLVAGLALGALSAWGLAPVVWVGGGVKEDDGNNVVVIVDDDAATTTSLTPTPLPPRSSSDDVELPSPPRRDDNPFSWNDVKLSLPRHDPLDVDKNQNKKRHQTCPVAGLAAQCPPRRDLALYENYTVREYYGGDWATTTVHSARLELAAAKGYATLSRYFNGNNDDNERMPATAPLVTRFVRDGTTPPPMGSDFVVSSWIPEDYQNDAPRPFDDQEIDVRYFGRETYFVANWTSIFPASAGTVVKKANELADSLDRNKEKYKNKTAWFMSYSPTLASKYYEVAFLKKGKKEEEN